MNRYVLAKTFDNLIEAKIDNNEMTTKLKVRDDAVIGAAVDDERAKSRKHMKELEFKHSEAMMSLLEATKGAVEHDLTVKVMEADGAIDENCKNAVDDMLFGFLSGCEAVTNDLNKNMDLFMDEERKLKLKEEKKKQVSERSVAYTKNDATCCCCSETNDITPFHERANERLSEANS